LRRPFCTPIWELSVGSVSRRLKRKLIEVFRLVLVPALSLISPAVRRRLYPVSGLRSHPQLASYCPPGRLTILWSACKQNSQLPCNHPPPFPLNEVTSN